MKKLISIILLFTFVGLTSCNNSNLKNAKEIAINGGDEITRKDGHKYIVIYNHAGNIQTMFHAGGCPNH